MERGVLGQGTSGADKLFWNAGPQQAWQGLGRKAVTEESRVDHAEEPHLSPVAKGAAEGFGERKWHRVAFF